MQYATRWLNLLLIGLWFWTSAFPARADDTDLDKGYIGSALEISKDSGYLDVSYMAANSPAAEAGIKKGDTVAAINSISTKGMSLAEARHAIDGEVGSTVTLTVQRDGSTEEWVTVVRRSTLDTYLLAATGGDPRAETALGYFYRHGSAATRDPVKAVEWYLKAAKQGYAPAETDLAICYLRGEGIFKSDRNAFDWFYSAARQDDRVAEDYLGFLYRKGRGVTRNDRSAFAWYYRSAQLGEPYGEWDLANMYDSGLGVKQNKIEALKWYEKAEVDLPPNEGEKIKKTIAVLSLLAFLENPDSAPNLNLSLIMAAFRQKILYVFIILFVAYVAGGGVLLYFTFKAPSPLKLSAAFGWIATYVESQGVAFLGLCILGTIVTADALISVTSIFCALPVIISSCGAGRNRIWKASQLSWKTLLLYGVSSFAAIALIDFGYDKSYTLITHSALQAQPTLALISKAKNASVWQAYVTIALLLPVAEEIIFRSYLFDALRRYCSGGTVVVITAAAFSLVHFQPLYFVPLFGCGLILGWVRLKTDSLRLPVLLHAFNNAVFLALAS